MTSIDPLARLRRGAARHAFEDGAIDVALGLFTVMVGAATQRRVWLALAVVYFSAMSMFGKQFHLQLTSRRTGYAEVPGDPPRQLFAAVFLAGLATMGVVAALTLASGRLWALDQWPKWTPVLAGLILAGGFLLTGLQTGLARFHLYTAASLSASVLFWLYPFGPRINPSDRLTLFLFVMAGVQMVVGAVTVARFVRTRPLVTEEAGSDR
jgi:hypothetical protein